MNKIPNLNNLLDGQIVLLLLDMYCCKILQQEYIQLLIVLWNKSDQNLEYILLGQGNNLRDRSIQMCAEAGFTPIVKMTMAQMVTAYRFADNGIGATFISDRLGRSPSSRLVFYKLDSSLTDRLFYFLLPERNYTAFAVRAFMEYAARHIQAAEISHGRDWEILQKLLARLQCTTPPHFLPGNCMNKTQPNK